MDRRRERLEQYRKQKAEKARLELEARPPWRPAGRATSARPPVKVTTSTKLTRVKRAVKSAPVLPRPTVVSVERERLDLENSQPDTPGVKPMTTLATPVSVQTIAESPAKQQQEQSDDALGTGKWLKVYEESYKKLETYQTRIDAWSCHLPDE